MKKFLCVVLLIALVACAIAFPMWVHHEGVSSESNSSVGLYYNGSELHFPVSVDYLVNEGWYLYCNESNGVLTLLNDKYDNMSVLIFAPNLVEGDLSDIQDDIDYICFGLGEGYVDYPNISLHGVSFGDSKDDVYESMGTPINDEGYTLNDVPYHHYFFSKSLDERTKASYEFVLMNGSVCDIKVSVDRLYGD